MKRKLLSGNYKPPKEAVVEDEKKIDSDEEFQREALTKLGGSIAFVRGRKFVEEN